MSAIVPDAGHIHCSVCGHEEPGSREEHLARIASDARNRCRCGALLAWRRDGEETRPTRAVQLVLLEV